MRSCAAAAERRPALLATLLAGPALAASLLPGWGEALVYDRAAILSGELWRLVTGHWVHFSASHLLWDALVVGIAAWVAASRGDRWFPLFCLAAALAISLGLLALLPELGRYGGLSGVAMAATVLLALRGLQGGGAWRDLWGWVLAASVVKLAVDAGGAPALVAYGDTGVQTVPLSHLLGAAVGAAAGAWPRRGGAACAAAGVQR